MPATFMSVIAVLIMPFKALVGIIALPHRVAALEAEIHRDKAAPAVPAGKEQPATPLFPPVPKPTPDQPPISVVSAAEPLQERRVLPPPFVAGHEVAVPTFKFPAEPLAHPERYYAEWELGGRD